MKTPYTQGFRAAYNGLTENPYTVEPERKSWAEGFAEAKLKMLTEDAEHELAERALRGPTDGL